MEPQLTVAISTIDDRVFDVPGIIQPQDDLVRYLILWQLTKEPPLRELLELGICQREDVDLIFVPAEGLVRNRNESILSCKTPLLLLADDDVKYNMYSFRKVIKAFKERPEADVLCFRALDENDEFLKDYPEEETPYENRPRGYAASSIEIAFRMKYNTPSFDRRFGLGSEELVCGEEDVFLHDAMLSGMQVRFVPVTICKTTKPTTSTRMMRSPKFIKSKGAALRVVHGHRGAWLRSVKYALQAPWGEKLWRFKLLKSGIRYIERTPTAEYDVSIIIPYRNRKDTLPRLFDSLLAIDYKHLEIILVDNGSTDGSFNLCEEFRNQHGDKFKRVAVLTEPEVGASYARNRGMCSSTGDYVIFFDSDDEFSPTFLREAVPMMGRCDMICARTRMVFPSGKTRTRKRIMPTTPASQILGGVLSTQTCLVRRDFYCQHPSNRGWDENLPRWNDLEVGLRLLLTKPVVRWMDSVHHHIHQHRDSISGPSLWESREDLLLALATMHQDLHESKERLSEHDYQSAQNALYGKTILTLDGIRKSGGAEPEAEWQEFIKEISDDVKPSFKRRANLLLRVWPRFVPGRWRALLYLAER